MARSARRGLLTVSDARGRVLAEASSTTRPMATLTAIVPLEHLETLYTRFGDWFAGLSAVLLIAALSRLRADQSTGGSESTCSSSR
jgi:apolipoprotein N-acyltransferase